VCLKQPVTFLRLKSRRCTSLDSNNTTLPSGWQGVAKVAVVDIFLKHVFVAETLKLQVLENASMENASTKQDILQGWKMQVLKTPVQVRTGEKRKYEYPSTWKYCLLSSRKN